jgi:hypothetical protein
VLGNGGSDRAHFGVDGRSEGPRRGARAAEGTARARCAGAPSRRRPAAERPDSSSPQKLWEISEHFRIQPQVSVSSSAPDGAGSDSTPAAVCGRVKPCTSIGSMPERRSAF